MGVGSGGQGGAVAPALDFQTWYKYSIKSLKSAYFSAFFAILRCFFRWPPLEEAK